MATVTLMGQVVLEDGQPLKEVIQVDLVCNGRTNQQTLTTADGSFYFELGSPRNDDWLDPGMGGSSGGSIEGVVKVAPPGGSAKLDQVPSLGQGRVSLSGCEIRAAPRAGYTSNIITLRTRDAFENPEVGLIVLRRLSNTKASTVSLSVLSAPPEAQKAYERASLEMSGEPPDTGEAEKELRKAIRTHPEFAGAWDLLGRIQMIEGRQREARESFLRAVKEEPEFIQPHLALTQLAVLNADWPEALSRSAVALQLDGDEPSALYWNGLAGYHTRDFEQGGRSLSRLYELGHHREYPFGLLPLGVIQANQGNIRAAAANFQLYLKSMPEDQVPEAQRAELQRVLNDWKAAGLVSLAQPAPPDPAPR